MSRFQQRLRERLRNPESAATFFATRAEIELLHAIEAVRDQLGLSNQELADRMGCQRSFISRMLTDDDANPTLETLARVFKALGVTAHIELRHASDGDAPFIVSVEDVTPAQCANSSEGKSDWHLPAKSSETSEPASARM